MAQLSKAVFYAKWVPLLADNEFQNINGARFESFLADVRDSFAGADLTAASVAAYDPKASYLVGGLVRYVVPGQGEAFYYALKAGLLPAPTGQDGDASWKVVPGPVAATTLYQAITLRQAQGLLDTVVPGRLYRIDFGPDAAGTARYVYALGLAGNFDVEGTLEVAGARSRVQVDVAAGTFAAVATGTGGGGTGRPFTNLPGGPVTLPQDGPQAITVPAGIARLLVYWDAPTPTGARLTQLVKEACYALTGTSLAFNEQIPLQKGDTIRVIYWL